MNDLSLKINKIVLEVEGTKVNALQFIPNKDSGKALATFTHGFTSSKYSILTWAQRMSDEGIPAIIFDQPGHFLGSFHDVSDFETFTIHAPRLFDEAIKLHQKSVSNFEERTLIFGGHSLGALTSLIHLENHQYTNNLFCIGVGFGFPPSGVTHIFQTPLFKATIDMRRQVVSEHLDPDITFPWIKERKENLQISNTRIHLITGEDDAIVGKTGSELLKDELLRLKNDVSLDKPSKLSHHQPEAAAVHIKKFLKSEGII